VDAPPAGASPRPRRTSARRREELFSAWRCFFERITERGTTVMVFEDLQRADPGSSTSSSPCWSGRGATPY
jgi:predicted ATPase